MQRGGGDSAEAFRVGPWRVDARLGECRIAADEGGSETIVRLTRRQMALLCYLASRASEVVTKSELVAEVWRGAAIGDDSITTAIYELRRALGGPWGSDADLFIETLPRRGYRLAAPVVGTPVRFEESTTSIDAALVAELVARRGANPLRDGSSTAIVVPGATSEKLPVPSENGLDDPATPLTARGWRRPWVLAALLLVAALVAGVLLAAFFGSYSIAVGEFANHTLDPQLDSTAAALRERIYQELDAAREPGHFRVTRLGFLARARLEGELRRDPRGRLRLRARLMEAAGTGELAIEAGAPDDRLDLLPAHLHRALMRGIDDEVCIHPFARQALLAEHCLKSGRRLLMERKFAKAAVMLEKGQEAQRRQLDDHPGDREKRLAWVQSVDLLASALDATGRPERAQVALATARLRLPGGESLESLTLQRRQAQIQGDVARDGKLLQRLRELDGGNADWRYRYAWYLRQHKRDCAYAIQQFDEALSVSSDADEDVRTTVWGYLGAVRLACGDAAQALDDLERYVEMRPDTPDAWERLAAAHLELGNYALAREHLNEALTADPEFLPALLQKGHLERELGHFEDARQAYRQFLTVAGELPNPQCEGLAELARLALMAGDATQALDLAGQAQTWRPECASGVWILGLAALARQDLGGARAALARLRAAVSAESSFRAEYRLHLEARLAEAEGEVDHAVELLDRALQLRPSERGFFLGERAALLARAGRWQAAREAAAQALDQNSAHPRGCCLAGRVAEELGLPDEAGQFYRRALDAAGEAMDDPAGRECLERFSRLNGKSR